MTIVNYEGKIIHCLNCPEKILCRCLEFDTDSYGTYYFCSLECYKKFNDNLDSDLDLEFGEYEGHYFVCELGGHFEEKWKELKKDRDNYKQLFEEFHKEWKELKYPNESPPKDKRS